MGKKTNWNPAEDQSLTRVWLSASDLQPQAGTPHFWTVVHDLFHQEVDTQRPLTGIKVRWTRINRDSQKFAAIFNELQSQHMKQAEESGGDSADAVAVALLKEQQWIDEAKSSFHRHYFSKFTFEACWKQLRYSTKWLQLCANSNTIHPVPVMNSLGSSTEDVKAYAATPNSGVKTQAAMPNSGVTEQETATTDSPSTACTHTTAALTTDPARASEVVTSTVAAAAAVSAVAQASTSDARTADESSSRKRRADAPLEALAHISNNQLQGLTSTLVDELRRQNDLMEDQNAIALLKVDGEMISDAEARHCFQLLRVRYLKKNRMSSRSYSNDRSSTLV
ncbi:hypothetical protein PRNP1_000681 [Phytophthora ramorum]